MAPNQPYRETNSVHAREMTRRGPGVSGWSGLGAVVEVLFYGGFYVAAEFFPGVGHYGMFSLSHSAAVAGGLFVSYVELHFAHDRQIHVVLFLGFECSAALWAGYNGKKR